MIGELKDTDDAQTIDAIKAYLSYIEKSLLNSPIDTKLISFNNYELIENIVLKSNSSWDGNILQFFESDFFVVDAYDKATIQFIKNNPLQSEIYQFVVKEYT
ncbi:hypothetical protein [Kamptonema sp. UHCC 0994]|uniref:hypothetical protein n=1 Tax=Kamptonema sp. UHCC 0994 TaxID=3031329 RepID=UPI0023BACD5B|nr:hypothetical protein [Kamptonema sp. UHCC 0994]MDF0556285.1 hypothetical protein [Kamptonema sp. UHCC 0994]